MIVLAIVVGVNTAKVEPVKTNNDMPNLAVLAQVAEALDPMEDELTADLVVEPDSDTMRIQTQKIDVHSVNSVTISRNQTPKSANLSRREEITNSGQEPSVNDKASAIISTAKLYLGVKYVWGGTSTAGFDCSGLIQSVFAKNDVTLPRVSCDQYTVGKQIDFNNLQPADLVFFTLNGDTVVNHVGIYVGDGQFINASSSEGMVVISEFSSYWTSYYTGAKRVL